MTKSHAHRIPTEQELDQPNSDGGYALKHGWL